MLCVRCPVAQLDQLMFQSITIPLLAQHSDKPKIICMLYVISQTRVLTVIDFSNTCKYCIAVKENVWFPMVLKIIR
jgi:hypothetical protein